MKQISPKKNIKASLSLPGSKSYSHRYLLAAALAEGISILHNVLDADDVNVTIKVLRGFGIPITVEKGIIAVYGQGGKLRAKGPIYVGDSGTSARFALALAMLCPDIVVLDGSERMRERPMESIINALGELGCEVSASAGGHLPATVRNRNVKGGRVGIDCSTSSQFLSALLLVAPLLYRGLTITTSGGLVSRGYVDMTMATMSAFGVNERQHEHIFRVKGKQQYRSGVYTVETDVSSASYFWAAAALTRGSVLVRGVGLNTLQGDIAFVKFLEKMGCLVQETPEGVRVSGSAGLLAIDADLGNTPDIAPTLAVTAAFARGQSVLRNVAHLQHKECDRVAALIEGLGVMGIKSVFNGNDLFIEGGEPKGGLIAAHNDHRMAMSFAVAGLAVSGVVIDDPDCVTKSFPNFWQVFESLDNDKHVKEAVV